MDTLTEYLMALVLVLLCWRFSWIDTTFTKRKGCNLIAHFINLFYLLNVKMRER